MNTFLGLLLVSLASGAMLPYDGSMGSIGAASKAFLNSAAFQGSADSSGFQGSSSFQGSSGHQGSGATEETRCTPYFDTVQKEHCENYNERTCTTTQRESCNDVGDQNCRAVVSSKQVRKCFNVTEQRCTLKENVQMDTIQVPIVVQKCQKVNERVCDTVYDSSSSLKEGSECINLDNPHCENVENTVFDTTCRTTTQFDCDTSDAGSGNSNGNSGNSNGNNGHSNNGGYGSGSNTGYGSGSNTGYGSGSGSGYGSGNSGNSGFGGSDSSTTTPYGQPQVNCRRHEDTKCYKTPRTVTIQQCSRRSERVCETVRVATPFVTARQSCRNEEKKVCDLEERTQPKQVKKYVYSKQCNAVPRTVCENADQKSLVPSCVGTTRKQCTYSPVEQCQDSPKEHCFQVNQKVRRERCETVTVGGYGSTGQGY